VDSPIFSMVQRLVTGPQGRLTSDARI
jgi:hypothetical protein